MQTLPDKQKSEFKEYDIIPIDISKHAGVQDVIDLAQLMQPIIEATQAYFALVTPQGDCLQASTGSSVS